jgi:hypothetical protein
VALDAAYFGIPFIPVKIWRGQGYDERYTLYITGFISDFTVLSRYSLFIYSIALPLL